MSENKKISQQELMKKFLEEKKNKGNQGSAKALRPEKGTSQSTSKAKRCHNGGGFFDK